MKIIFILAIAFSIQEASADRKGNGGDLCELRIQTIRNDISDWITKGGSKSLVLPAEVQHEVYQDLMIKNISTAVVSCVDKPILIGQTEKTCMNFSEDNQNPRIVCNSKRFMESDESEQYVLIHHEYAGLAGLAGFEDNQSESSRYSISQQISGYLEVQKIKRLVVKPRRSSSCGGVGSDLDKIIVDAINSDDIACVEEIAPLVNLQRRLKVGDKIPGTNWGDKLTPLAYASRLGRTQIIQALIDSGADVHFTDYIHTPISIAAFVGQIESIKVLVKNGAFLNYNSCPYGQQYIPCSSPLGMAVGGFGIMPNTYRTVETLLELGASPNLITDGEVVLSFTKDFALIDLLVKHKAEVNGRGSSGSTPIFFCISAACVDKLVSLGANVNILNFSDHSPLDYAIAATPGEVAKALIKHGARPNKPF